MALTTPTEKVEGRVPITVRRAGRRARRVQLRAARRRRPAPVRGGDAAPPDRPERPDLPRQLRARRAPLDRPRPARRGAVRPRGRLGRVPLASATTLEAEATPARGPAGGSAARRSSGSSSGRARPAVRRPSGPGHRDRRLLSSPRLPDDAAPPVRPGETVAGEVVAGAGADGRSAPADPRPVRRSRTPACSSSIEDPDGRGHRLGRRRARRRPRRVGGGDPLRAGQGDGRARGRPWVRTRSSRPVVASLAASLAALATTSHEHHPGGEAAHRLEAELALSRRIQRSLIPLTPPDLRGYEVASHYEAAREVGGDFFDVFPLRDRAGRAGDRRSPT